MRKKSNRRTTKKASKIATQTFDVGPTERAHHSTIAVDNVGTTDVIRARVLDPFLIDRLFLKGTITQEQHNAGVKFMEACRRSGGMGKASSYEPQIGQGVYGVSDRLAMSVMALSDAMTVLRREVGAPVALLLFRLIVNEEEPRSMDHARKALDVLVLYYGRAIRKRPGAMQMMLG